MTHILISFLFYNLLINVFYTHYKKGQYYVKKSNWVLYILLLIAFGTYGGGEGDYLHYKEAVENIHSLADVFYYRGMEIQYYYLANLLNGDYTLWRLVVYSIQFIGLGWFLYKADLNTYPVLLAFTSLFLVTSVYGRVYWGVIYFFMGLYLLIQKKNPLYLIAIALCYVSHTSNLILVALLPLGFVELKRWHLLMIIILFSSIVAVFNDYFELLLSDGGIEGADYFNDKVNIYSNTGSFVYSFWGNSTGEKIVFLVRHIPLLFFLIYLMRFFLVSYDKFLRMDKPIRRVISIYFGLNLVAFVFLFADMGTGTYFYRVLAMTFFSVTIILPYLLKTGYLRKPVFNNYILVFIIASEINYLKDMYYASVAGL